MLLYCKSLCIKAFAECINVTTPLSLHTLISCITFPTRWFSRTWHPGHTLSTCMGCTIRRRGVLALERAPEGAKAEEVPGDPVPPGEERVYNWRISRRQGPSASEFDCKAGAYYSDVNMVIQCATHESKSGRSTKIVNFHVVFNPKKPPVP